MLFVDQVLEFLINKETGAIDVNQGKKRWVFYFESGQLVQTKSNLKSEQGPALREKFPEADTKELLYQQSLARLLKATNRLNTFKKSSSAASKKSSLATADLFIEAFSHSLSQEELDSRCETLAVKTPKRPESLSLRDEELNVFISGMNENLKVSTCVGSSQIDARKVWTCLWLLWRTEQMEFIRADNEEEAIFDFDLNDLLNEEEELDIPADNEAPAESPAEDTPKRHPMADKLEELRFRINDAANHFEVLDRPWDSSADDFRRAYRDLSMDLHPDRYNDATTEMQELATELFDKIRAAWEVLENDETRKKYIDKEIHGIKSEEEQAMEALQTYWAAEEDFKRGLALFNQGRIPQAHQNFQKAVEAYPDELEFRAYLGYTKFYTMRNSNKEAALDGIDEIREVIDINQSQERKLDSAWMLIGRAYRENEEPEKAKRALKQALKINPSNSDALKQLKRLMSPNKQATQKSTTTSKKNDKKAGGFFGGLWGKKK
ncbi:MAG: J domain-containing protein [Myxococcota bacterium]|nr:J domain-containing protein [Myxococcota bacterium]